MYAETKGRGRLWAHLAVPMQLEMLKINPTMGRPLSRTAAKLNAALWIASKSMEIQ
jgi:hypothetical protein